MTQEEINTMHHLLDKLNNSCSPACKSPYFCDASCLTRKERMYLNTLMDMWNEEEDPFRNDGQCLSQFV